MVPRGQSLSIEGKHFIREMQIPARKVMPQPEDTSLKAIGTNPGASIGFSFMEMKLYDHFVTL